LAIWGSLGIAIGAAIGAGESIEHFSQFSRVTSPPWQWFGACGGLLLVAGLWTAIQRRRFAALVLAKIVIITQAVFLFLRGG
jgi:hypothetical protein